MRGDRIDFMCNSDKNFHYFTKAFGHLKLFQMSFEFQIRFLPTFVRIYFRFKDDNGFSCSEKQKSVKYLLDYHRTESTIMMEF